MDMPQLVPSGCALAVVDMQNDFCHPEGSYARRGVRLAPAVPEIVHNLQRLIDAARRHRMPVFFIRMENSPWSDSPAWRRRRERLGRDPGAPPTCAAGSWGAEFFGVAPQAGDCVLTKHRFSAFVDTPLELYLRSLEVRTLVLGGVVTNVCVDSTARDAFMRDYWTVTVADCCAAGSLSDHRAALHNLDRNFGEVLALDAVLEAWKEAAVASS